jgi:hypothetical protein
MAAIVNALDNFTPSQIGENGHREFTWSNNIQERIIQLTFQLTRTNDSNQVKLLAMQIDKILTDLKKNYISGIARDDYILHMTIMYKMIAHTRDIIDGKGEYLLSFMMLSVWHKHYPDLATFAFKHFLLPPIKDEKAHQYGCWKDVKNYSRYENKVDALLEYGIKTINEQIRTDVYTENPSLAARWVPREKSQYPELYTQLAIDYFPEYLASTTNEASRKRATTKAKMNYRHIISALNDKLDTVQIKQCGNRWKEIDPKKQTSITMHKQKKAFLNLKKDGNQRNELEDRIICANKFTEFSKKAANGEVEVKGQRIGLNDFAKNAIQLLDSRASLDSPEVQLLNAQWVDNSKQTGQLGNIIAMADVSGSMSMFGNADPLHACLSLSIRVAEKSKLGKRVLTFSQSPKWCILEGKNSYIEMVDKIYRTSSGLNTNFYAALKLILDAIEQQKLKPEDVADMILAVFSDMQIDQGDKNFDSMYNGIEQMYSDVGMRLWGKPFKVPHILFWNLRSSSGAPSLSIQPNVSMMSGFSPALLNLFCEEGMAGLESYTPWKMLVNSLANKRYDVLETFLREVV